MKQTPLNKYAEGKIIRFPGPLLNILVLTSGSVKVWNYSGEILHIHLHCIHILNSFASF